MSGKKKRRHMETLGRRPCEDGGRDLKAKGTQRIAGNTIN